MRLYAVTTTPDGQPYGVVTPPESLPTHESAAAPTNFEGRGGNGEHRTVGPHRAWCGSCHAWCYPDDICPCCDAAVYDDPLDRDVFEWAVRECGGIEQVHRGMEFDALPVGTVLDGANGHAVAAHKAADGWETQHYGAGPYPDDVRAWYIAGRLVKREPRP